MKRRTLNRVHMEFLSLPENIGLARIAVASFVASLDLTLNDMEDLKVAVSEAVSNSIIHGYNNKGDGLVTVEVIRYEDELEIVVKDDGRGIENIHQAMQPAFSTDPERMGLGFVFMQTFMDRVKVESTPGQGTRVIMNKNLVALVVPEAREI